MSSVRGFSILVFPAAREDVGDRGGRKGKRQPKIGRYSGRMRLLGVQIMSVKAREERSCDQGCTHVERSSVVFQLLQLLLEQVRSVRSSDTQRT